jgi:hypothetical protein
VKTSAQKSQPFFLAIILCTTAMFFVFMFCTCANCCGKCQCCEGSETEEEINELFECARERE